MVKQTLKYIASLATMLLVIQMVFGEGMRGSSSLSEDSLFYRLKRDSITNAAPDTSSTPKRRSQGRLTKPPLDSLALSDENRVPVTYDSLMSRRQQMADTTSNRDTTQPTDSTHNDSLRTSNFLDDIISGKNKDSLKYRPKEQLVYIYNGGDVTYGNMNMKADFIRVELQNKQIYANGVTDTTGQKTRPIFAEGGSNYTMDTILYNISSGKAKIKGVATQEGEGFLIGDDVKKMPDNSININGGKYTTCDHVDHPHYFIAMTKAKVIPQKKIIIGPSYLVMEDVPIPLGIPEGFFPISQKYSSGIIIPSYGEESTRGFFLRDGGYYWAIGDHMDLLLKGSIYTYGSWEVAAASNYVKRYKFSGNMSAIYSRTIIGEKGEANYQNVPSVQVQWVHRQDPKANPGTTFNANINFASSGFRQYAATNLNDIVSTTTTSSIAYGKTWTGTPFSLTANMRLNTNSRDSTVDVTLPTATLNMTKIFPFRRKNAVGKQRWYEKISLGYTGNLQNSVKAKESEMFTGDIFNKMRYGVQHRFTTSTSFNLFNYINISPSANYNEDWTFKYITKTYDPNYNNGTSRDTHVKSDTINKFGRMWSYNFNIGASTKIYGTYDFTKHKKFPLKMLRHTITPTIGFSYAPNFSDAQYGYYLPYQTNESGEISYYTPFLGSQSQSPPGRGQTGSITFSLSQTLEAKVASKRDTSGMKKVSIIDEIAISGSYNLLADSMKLSTIPIRLRMTIPGLKNFGININATLDPYEVAVNQSGTSATRINKLMIANGKGLGRITSASWNTSYTFNSKTTEQGAESAAQSIQNANDAVINPYLFDPDNPLDAITRRQLMTAAYYDFSVPWNLTLSYGINYANNGAKKNIIQTLTYSGMVRLTPNWGITVSGGFDFKTGKLTTGMFSLTRDLHCWQMSFSWVPIGTRRSWQFNISVKSASLQDLKYEKQSSYLDNIDWDR